MAFDPNNYAAFQSQYNQPMGSLSPQVQQNLQNTDFGMQAGQNGSQNGVQSFLFNKPQYNQNGTAQSGGFNTDNIGLALGGVQMLGNLWNSYQQHKMAKEQLSFQKDAYKTNLANSTQTYNTALEDRIRARHNTEGKGEAATSSYLSEHSL